MQRHSTIKQLPIRLDFDVETAFEKALVRLAQCSQPVQESFPALRTGTVVLQIAGFATVLAGLAGALAMARSDLDEALGFPAEYLSGVLVIAGALAALVLLVVGDILSLHLAVARNTRLVTVLLAEMNLADRAERHRSEALDAFAAVGVPKAATV